MPLTRAQKRKNGKGKRDKAKVKENAVKWQQESGCSIHPAVNMEHCKNFMKSTTPSGEAKRQGLVMLTRVKDNETMLRAVTEKFGKNFKEFQAVMSRMDTSKIPINHDGEYVEKNLWDLINDARKTDNKGAHDFADEQHITTIKAILTHMWGNLLLEKAWGIPDMVAHFEDMAFTLTGDAGADKGEMSSSTKNENYMCAMRWYEGQKRGMCNEESGNGIDMANDKYWEVILTPSKDIYEHWVRNEPEDEVDKWEDVEASQERLGKQIHKTFGFDLLSSIFSFGSSFENFKKVMDEA